VIFRKTGGLKPAAGFITSAYIAVGEFAVEGLGMGANTLVNGPLPLDMFKRLVAR
jgi:hypothetical protein